MGKKVGISLGLVMLVAVFFVVGLSGSALAAQPANVGDPVTRAGSPGVYEVQSFSLVPWNPGDTWTFSWNGGATVGPIAYGDATYGAQINTVYPNITGTDPGTGGYAVDLTWNVYGPQVLATINVQVGGVGPDVPQTVVHTVTGAAPGVGPTDVSPHGGYSAQTDYCLQCHQQHGAYPNTTYATGSFALLRAASVTETCNTCHSIFLQGGTSAFDPGIAGLQIGTAAARSVYENGAPDNHASLDTASCAALVGTAKPANCTYPAIPMAGAGSTTAPVYGHKIGYGVSATSLGTGSPVNSATRYTAGWTYAWNFIGQTSAPASSTTKSGPGTASRIAGGFYCDSCHTPHGADLGYAVNTEKGHASSPSTITAGAVTTAHWDDGNVIAWHNTTGATAAGVANNNWGNVYLQKVGGALNTGWNVCQSLNTNCVPATTANAQGQQVSLYAYQLLTMANHQYQGAPNNASSLNKNLCSNGLPGSIVTDATGSAPNETDADCAAVYGAGVTAGYASNFVPPTGYGITAYGHDKAQWCGTCHSYALDSTLGGVVHAHPTGCDACHGNTPASIATPGGAAGYPDFPHTSLEESMLQSLPDGLCISCHKNLP